jgi:hypothetical protein
VFECLACNLLQISPLELCFEKLRFFLNVFSECRKCYFGDPILKISGGGGMPILSWREGKEKIGPMAVLPHH